MSASILQTIERWVDLAFSPIRTPLEMLGFHPTNFGIYLTFVSGLMLFMAWSVSGGHFLLFSERRRTTTGIVVGIDESDDPPTARIRFTDPIGREWTFDSDLPFNAATRQIGGRVAVTYDVKKPSTAQVAGSYIYRIVVTLLLLAGAGVVLAFAFGLLPSKPG